MTATHPPQDEGTAAEAGQAKVDRLRVATARWRITSPARTTRRGRQLHQLVIDCTQVFLRSFGHYGLYLDSMTGFQASRVEDCRPRRAHDGPPDWSTDSRSALPTCVRAPSSRAVDIGARAWHGGHAYSRPRGSDDAAVPALPTCNTRRVPHAADSTPPPPLHSCLHPRRCLHGRTCNAPSLPIERRAGQLRDPSPQPGGGRGCRRCGYERPGVRRRRRPFLRYVAACCL